MPPLGLPSETLIANTETKHIIFLFFLNPTLVGGEAWNRSMCLCDLFLVGAEDVNETCLESRTPVSSQ